MTLSMLLNANQSKQYIVSSTQIKCEISKNRKRAWHIMLASDANTHIIWLFKFIGRYRNRGAHQLDARTRTNTNTQW